MSSPSMSSPLYTVPPGHLLLHLSSGKTAAFSLPSNPAASFYLYIPTSHPVSRRKRGEDIDPNPSSTKVIYPLVVCVHGSARDAQGVRDRWADTAEREGFVVLSPLFPVDMETVDGMHNYKLLRHPLGLGESSTSSLSSGSRTYTRFDRLLLEMVDLVRDRWGFIETDTFGLTGYSGGAQFAHRFFYLHPARVSFISAGAPGAATPLSSPRSWPAGISDVSTVFDGAGIEISGLRQTPTHLIVGLEDKWRPVANDGSTPKMNRIETMRMLRDDWRANGLSVEYEEIEGAGHEETGVLDRVQAFVLDQLRRLRSDRTGARLDQATPVLRSSRPLSLDEYERYGRQMILPGFGLPGQLRLKAARVAVVGAGGLGCPVLQYLAGAGVGSITVIDHDTVGISNLHRQVLHSTDRVGMNKAASAALAINSLNPHVKVITHETPIDPTNAISLLTPHDLLIDCTDRPMTRYLLSDASVAIGIPLVSGAAISSAGQWAVYGDITPKGKRRACYRCLWPSMVNAGGNDRCEELGVYGVVTGMVGTGMASEVIKVLLGNDDEEPLLHMLHLGGNPLIRTIRIRPPSPKCIACAGTELKVEEFDYATFCSGPADLGEQEPEFRRGERLSVQEFAHLISNDKGTSTIIDTRPELEFGICSIPNTINTPLTTILSSPETIPFAKEMVFICKKGNDSQLAAAALRKRLAGLGEEGRVSDVRGGLVQWAKEVDKEFPLY